MSENQKDSCEMERETPEVSETASIQHFGKIVVSWEKDKQMNDIWKAFDKIDSIVFKAWGISRAEAEALVKTRAKEAYVPGKGRYYAKAAGSITFYDDGRME